MNHWLSSSKTDASDHLAKRQARRAAGFTLVEMLVVVAMFGILAMIAAPSLSSLIASQRASAMATDVYVALIETRSEAIKRNTNVTLAPKTGGWQAGWTILAPDPNDTDSTLTLDDHSAATGTSISGPDNVVYQSSGRVHGNSAPCIGITATQGTSTAQRWVTVDLSGRPLATISSCS